MTVKIRVRGNHVQYDIRFRWPDGTTYRERKNAPVTGKAAAKRWAEAREAALLAAGKPAPAATTKTLAEFWPDVLRDHYQAERKKPSTIDAAKTIYTRHLAPLLGARPLAELGPSDFAALKGRLANRKPKTVNNVIGVLSRILRCAVNWGVITSTPGKLGMLVVEDAGHDWYEPADFRRLVDGAAKVGSAELVVVLLGGSAGLRRGEMQALRWTDIDMPRRLVHVRRGIYRAGEHAPKGNRGRTVPMTAELHAALKAHRHLGDRVLAPADPERTSISKQTLALYVRRAQRRAGLPETGHLHTLRHTYCSHLAIAGVPARAIQELAGHADLKTTLRYMHLSPDNKSAAVGALARLYAAAEDETKEKTA